MKRKIKQRQIDILKLLVTSTSPIEVEALINKFGKSERTIRYDIRELKEICAAKNIAVKYKTKLGYYIPAEQKGLCSQILVDAGKKAEPKVYPDVESDRIQHLYFYFVVKDRKTIAEQIAADFYVSRSTLIREITRFNEFFKGEIYLSSFKTGGYKMAGNEFVIRHTGMNYLAQCFKGSYTTEDWFLLLPEGLKNDLDLQTITVISNHIKKINAKYNVWLSNSAFIHLLCYCIIRHLRLRSSQSTAGTTNTGMFGGYSAELLMTPGCNAELTAEEINNIQCILNENEIMVSSQAVDDIRLQKSLQKIMELLFSHEEESSYVYDLKGLYNDLFEHLKNAICFCEPKTSQENNNYVVIHEVKEHYPYFYQEAKNCSRILETDFHITFTETEICYIGIYLYKNCREKNQMKKNVLLVCATGKGLSHLLSIRLENTFPYIRIADQISPFQLSGLKHKKNIDFIISTIPLDDVHIPVVKISRILSSEDIQRIQEFLDYSKLVDEIPLEEQANASFNSKSDPFQIEKANTLELSSGNLAASATAISKLILTLLEYTSKFPKGYRLEQDALLGLIIHMSMAIPRWFENDKKDSQNDLAEYEMIAEKHGVIFEIMERFFDLVEKSLKVKILVKERIAFFLYIILKEES